jgi:porin
MLARHGMRLEIESIDEGFANSDATLNTVEGSRYAGLTDLIFSIDTGDADWWSGGIFVIDLQNTRGGNISDIVGDLQGISNISAPPGTRFAEYFLDQRMADGKFRLKIGKQDANTDFVVSDGGSEFINSSFGIIPTVPLPTFPAPALGVMAGWSPSGIFHFKAGFWDGAPVLGSGVSMAIIDGSNGTVGAVGMEIRPFGKDILEGTYRVGFWRHSEVEIAKPIVKEAVDPLVGPAHGIYFTADQDLWASNDRRLSVFAQGGWGNADRSAISRYFGGGLTLRGPFKARPDDMVGIGLACAKIGRLKLSRDSHMSETVVELFYRLPLTGWLSLNPDLQWISQPGGADDTIFVAGLRIATVF